MDGPKPVECKHHMFGRPSEFELDNIVCIYHAGCLDGTMAAALIAERFRERCRVVPAMYGRAAPKVELNETVIIVDFSYKRALLRSLSLACKKVIVFDHHVTAMAELVDFDPLFATVFDMERSGAGLVWDWLHDGEKRDPLVDAVEDYDLWKFKCLNTREIAAYLSTAINDIPRMCNILDRERLDTIVEKGRAICSERDRNSAILAGGAQYRLTKKIGVVDLEKQTAIAVVNCPTFYVNDVADIILNRDPVSIVLCWHFDNNGYRYSMRSRGFDVSGIAKGNEGGGHASAAGFSSPTLLPYTVFEGPDAVTT